MATIGLTVVIAVIAVIIIKYLIQYFQQLRLNFSIANPGKFCWIYEWETQDNLVDGYTVTILPSLLTTLFR